MADAGDLKSPGRNRPCGLDSHPGHHPISSIAFQQLSWLQETGGGKRAEQNGIALGKGRGSLQVLPLATKTGDLLGCGLRDPLKHLDGSQEVERRIHLLVLGVRNCSSAFPPLR